jgi:predicted Zn-dependent protease
MTCTPEDLALFWAKVARWSLPAFIVFAPIASLSAASIQEAARLVSSAQGEIARGDGIAAEVHLRQAMDNGAAREAVAAYMGEALIAQDQPDRARDWLAPGIFTRATEPLGFRTLARLEQMEGNLAAAGAAFDRVIALTPKDATLWVEIAYLRYAGGEHMLALDAANYAFELDPRNVRVLEMRGTITRDQRGLVAALPWFKAALARSPDDPSVLAEYAATLGDLGRAKEMLALTRRLLEVDPGNPRAYYLQAILAARAGNIDLARRLLGRTGGRLDAVPAVRLLDGILEMRAGNYVLASEAFEELARRQPGNERIRELLVRALFLSGEYRQLVIRFAQAGEQSDASPYLLTVLARSYETLGDRVRAAVLLDRAALSRVSLPGQIELPTPDPLEVSPVAPAGNFDAEEQAGDLMLSAGNGPRALAHYRSAARVRVPETLMLRMASAYRAAGQPGAARSMVEAYLVGHPGSEIAARLCAKHAVAAGDWKRARLILENLQMNGGRRDVRTLTDLSLAQLRTGDGGAAIAHASEAYSIQRSSPLAASSWGLSLAFSGEKPHLARALLDKAQKLSGDDALIAEARRRLDARRAI